MRSKTIPATALIAATLMISACGGGGGGSPAPAGADAGGAPAAAPGPAAAPAPPPGGAPAPSTSTIPSLASIPAGLPTGGSGAKTSSGYSDTLLAGRWQQNFGSFGNCLPVPATATCNREYSVRFAIGFTATGLAAARISELTYFTGASCAPSNQLGVVRFAQDIAFEAADTSIPDDTVLPPGTIAVRRGLLTGERFDTSGLPDAQALFAGCEDLNPGDSPQSTVTCSDSTVSLRIETGAGGVPALLADEDEQCVPGTTKPPVRYTARWSLDASDGLTKLP